MHGVSLKYLSILCDNIELGFWCDAQCKRDFSLFDYFGRGNKDHNDRLKSHNCVKWTSASAISEQVFTHEQKG